ncbi:MAG: penicillin acylase family protein, partial [Myxococcota bacterium]
MQLHSTFRGAFDVARRLIPRRRPETQVLRGLEGDVEVLTDDWGVPHIYADTAHDLFFAQGFVTARDRMFQMDYNRHGAAGRLCELVGRRELPWRDLTVHLKAKTTFDVDVMLRTFGMARSARDSLPMHSQESRDMLTAYAAGVNAYIATGARTLEHRILRTDPEPWRELDSLLMLKGIGFELNFSWRSALVSALLDQADVPEDLARVLWPHYRPGGPTIVDPEAWAQVATDLARTREAAGAALGMGNAPGVGSNSFVVAASHSKNGDALAANDTHLVLMAPQPWHEVRLHGGGFDMRGFALTGVPGITIGKTPHHTWGITAGMVQDLDLFVERLHPDDPKRYLTPDGWQTLFEREEEIIVRGEKTEKRTIFESRHGPLLETVATEADAGYRYAVAWTGHRPGRDLDGLLGVWKAESFAEFRESLRHLVCPTYNITYADRCPTESPDSGTDPRFRRAAGAA